MQKMRSKGLTEKDLLREISMLRESRGCDNITQLLDTFQDETYYYIALEYCAGGDFGDKLKERGDDLEEFQAARWMRHIINAIDFLHHRSVIHRDIKPDNFLVGRGEELKLSDFGLAMKLAHAKTLLTDKCGTPAFMAPEQHLLPKSKGYGLPIDIWAAGICMWCLLHGGLHPFMDGQALILPELLQGTPAFRKASGFWSSSRWSDEAIQLNAAMTSSTVSNRPSARSVLNNEWFKRYPEGDQHSQTKSSKSPRSADTPKGGEPSRPPSMGAVTRMQEDMKVLQDALAKERQVSKQHAEEAQKLQNERDKEKEKEKNVGNPNPHYGQSVGSDRPIVGNIFQSIATGVKGFQENLSGLAALSEGFFGGSERKVSGKFNSNMTNVAKPQFQISASQGSWVPISQKIDEIPRNDPPPPIPQPSPRIQDRVVLLQPGSRVKYESVSLGQTVDCIVQSFNESDNTYNLDLKQRAPLNMIMPPTESHWRWPPRTSIIYESSSLTSWIDGIIADFNEDDKTYDLATPDGNVLKERALATKIRPRAHASTLCNGFTNYSAPAKLVLNRNPDMSASAPMKAASGMWGYDTTVDNPLNRKVSGKLEDPFAADNQRFANFSTAKPTYAPNLSSRPFASTMQPPVAGATPACGSDATPGFSEINRQESSLLQDDNMQHISILCKTCNRQYWSVSGKSSCCPMCRADDERNNMASSTESRGTRILIGTTCSFQENGTGTWIHGVLREFTDSGVFLQAPGARVYKPWQEVCPPDTSWPPWPRGSWVIYESVSHNAWVPAIIMATNEDGSYNLNNKNRAQRERIRIRLVADFGPTDKQGQPLTPVLQQQQQFPVKQHQLQSPEYADEFG